jgi:cyclic pyranopterin phosphate synthase
MVDVGHKPETDRRAVATGRIRMSAAALRQVVDGTLPKGDALAAARLAGTQAAKQTPYLIPLCHPLPLTHATLDIAREPDGGGLRVRAEVRTRARTGAEMEALTAVAVALLTIYDMAKGVDRDMVIEDIALLAKQGGASGDWTRPAPGTGDRHAATGAGG